MELPAAHAKAENEARAQRHASNACFGDVSTGFFHFQKYSPQIIHARQGNPAVILTVRKITLLREC